MDYNSCRYNNNQGKLLTHPTLVHQRPRFHFPIVRSTFLIRHGDDRVLSSRRVKYVTVLLNHKRSLGPRTVTAVRWLITFRFTRYPLLIVIMRFASVRSMRFERFLKTCSRWRFWCRCFVHFCNMKILRTV